MAQLYDIVFFGTQQQGEQLKHTKARVAKLLHLDQEKTEALFARSGGVVLRSGVSAEIAEKYQKALTQAGVRCNSQPSKRTVQKLELVPTEEDGGEDKQFTCPACGYHQSFDVGEQPPSVCARCGVVPEKYSAVNHEKAERERIKRALLARHKASVEQEEAQQHEQEERRRRERIEREIRKELGLPRVLAGRFRLVGSAVAVLLVGVGVGAATTLFYGELQAPLDSSSSSLGASAMFSADATLRDTMASLDGDSIDMPALNAVAQVTALSRDLRSGKLTDESGSAGLKGDSGATGQDQSHSLVLEMLNDLRQDREWDQYLASVARSLVASQQFTDAFRISSRIQSGVKRIDVSGSVAHAFPNREATKAMIADLIAEAGTLADPVDRVRALCLLAAHEAAAGNQAESEQLVEEAEAVADAIDAPDATAVAISRVAAAWAKAGSMVESRAAFDRVNALMSSISDSAARLVAYAEVAQAYVDAGNKGAALRMLSQAHDAAQNIGNADQRNRVLARIALNQARAGDVDGAVATAGAVTSSVSRNALLLQIVGDQLYSGDLYKAMAAAEPIDNPLHAARAAALLARYQSGSELDVLAQENFDRAIAASQQLSSPVDKAGLLSEVARLYERAGSAEAARRLFETALQIVEETGDAHTRDITSAVIAKNQARALQTDQASKTLLNITDEAISRDVRDDLARIDATIALVREVLPVRTASTGLQSLAPTAIGAR